MLEAAGPSLADVVPFVWSSCGIGCSTTSTKVLSTDDTVFGGSVSARVAANEVHVRFTTMSANHYYLIAARRLVDGALLGAVRASGQTSAGTICSPIGFAPSAPHVFPFLKSTSAGTNGASTSATVVAGLLTPNGFVWSPPAAGVPVPQTSVLENDIGWGAAFYDGSLRVMMPPDAEPLALVDQGSYPAYSAVGRASLVVSNPALSGSPDEVIRAWEPDRPSRTLVAQADAAMRAVALSDTTMTWAAVHGPMRREGTYSAAELQWTPFPAGKDSVPIMGGTSLTEVGGTIELQTWGDYAAVMSTDRSKKFLAVTVVRFSDGRTWILRHRTGAIFVRLLAVSPTEIVVGENDDTGDPALVAQMQHLTRYDLSALDGLAASH